jgi:hypothetical protein
VGIPPHLRAGPHRAQRVGDLSGEVCGRCSRETAVPQEKAGDSLVMHRAR